MKEVIVNSGRWLSLDNFNGEKWECIKDFPNYAVSNFGRIKRLSHFTKVVCKNGTTKNMFYKERIVRLAKNKYGYYLYRPTKDGRCESIIVHRCVASAFIKNQNNYPFVNHKDEDKGNNKVSNLEWCTAKYNSNYGTAQYRHSESLRKVLRPRVYLVKQYTKDGCMVNEYRGKKEIVDAGFNYDAVVRCCKHLSKTSYGFVWRRNNDKFNYEKDNRNDDCCKKIVLCYDLNNNFVAEYFGTKEAVRAIGKADKSSASISRCCLGHRPTAFGFIWKYKQ